MKERPILFSAAMVRAILAGTKTQTRRPVNERWLARMEQQERETGYPRDGVWGGMETAHGMSGDRLWVKETWALSGEMADYSKADLDKIELAAPAINPRIAFQNNLRYRADAEGYDDATQSWRPSIFMRRWASRIDLEITEVRVQRLQDISEEDARAEGVELPALSPPGFLDGSGLDPDHTHRVAFAKLWDSINGDRGFEWAANPWVWALTFRRVQP